MVLADLQPVSSIEAGMVLADLQPVAPDSLEKITEGDNEGIFFDSGQADVSMAQLHSLVTHFGHQHSLRLGLN